MGTCLHLVSHFGYMTMAYVIISRAPNVEFLNVTDKQLRTPLMCAVVSEKLETLKLLVQCGSDVTIKVRVLYNKKIICNFYLFYPFFLSLYTFLYTTFRDPMV